MLVDRLQLKPVSFSYFCEVVFTFLFMQCINAINVD